jgi:tripartite-type tricarboxylate transporter receptor subunit TctC
MLKGNRMTSKQSSFAFALMLLAAGASAQTYPTRAIPFITVAAPGTVGDIIPRVVSSEVYCRDQT